MKIRAVLLLSLVVFTSNLFAGDRWIPIAGTVGAFRTDTRILNPSGEKDIEVSAYFLPVGVTNNNERVFGTPVKITIAKRSQKVLDDVVASVFSASGLGAILLTSPDNFIATSRIYAQVGATTLGQGSAAVSPGNAFPKGVIVQLKSNGAFRSNVGAVNIANAQNQVTFNLYDKANTKVATLTKNFAAYEVLGPSNIAALFQGIAAGADLNDAWVSFTATNPLIAYGSVIDNASTDPTFIDMSQDTGSDPVVVVETKSFDVTLADFSITLNAAGLSALKVGDKVEMRVRATSGTHGFTLFDPNGNAVVPDALYSAGGPPQSRNFTVARTGTYTYFCTNSTCGTGHTNMSGTFDIR